ncbi:transcription/translation regulatory transformer protein RfaH [Vibrio panuliri]|uniref:Transcription antitermination protein RfaH n=1 Tax=Vibrio panuliri TaxID=1381081 RepID=A0ABX3FNM2_9VIBR|nr:transcription/translation regulatory transformer protein RfaH [Vibrio panuliri]KAB1457289.1 transcription/translation regulatory transformer protein RfaH [Vibrio panuliri]OLQ95816.1 transcriptional activator RfaH [Vibrio panuliri]
MKSWYLLFCKKQEQLRAKTHLENQGVDCFYPELEVEKNVRGKVKKVREPLFPSYIFINFDADVGPSFTTIRSTRGVVDFVRCGLSPQVVSEDLIVGLKAIDDSQRCVSEIPVSGDIVRVVSGQYLGVQAIYEEPDGERRSFLLINLLNNQVKISVENCHLDF